MTGSRPTAFPLRLILSILMGFALLYLGWGFVRQARVSHDRREELIQLEQQIKAAQEEKVSLEESLGSAQSPEAAEAWARQNGWAKEDEVSIVVVAPSGQPSPGDGQAQPGDGKPGPKREAWWDLFFGNP
jgi:Septum formation initiator